MGWSYSRSFFFQATDGIRDLTVTGVQTCALPISADTDNVTLAVSQREVRLTNLRKPFWPALGITKGGLIQYYVDVAPVLLPHIADRPMVMKRYPHGADG